MCLSHGQTREMNDGHCRSQWLCHAIHYKSDPHSCNCILQKTVRLWSICIATILCSVLHSETLADYLAHIQLIRGSDEPSVCKGNADESCVQSLWRPNPLIKHRHCRSCCNCQCREVRSQPETWSMQRRPPRPMRYHAVSAADIAAIVAVRSFCRAPTWRRRRGCWEACNHQ